MIVNTAWKWVIGLLTVTILLIIVGKCINKPTFKLKINNFKNKGSENNKLYIK